jgi:hypothetical protein
MSVEERLARLETKAEGNERWLTSIDGKVDDQQHKLTLIGVAVGTLETSVGKMGGKLDQILETATMGKGAWWALLRLGIIATALITAAWSIYAHLNGRHP